LSRRRDALSFQHHAEVAALPEAEQDLWLSRAKTDGWSRNELRRRLADRARPIATATAVRVVQLSIPPEREEVWRRAAACAQQDLTAWVLSIADAAASALLEPGCRGELTAPDAPPAPDRPRDRTSRPGP
jgi:hypothetical protein